MITEAHADTRDLLDRYYEAVDAFQVDKLLGFFAPDARMTFANFPTVVGRESIREALSGILGAITGIRHDLRAVWETEGGLVAFEVDVTYTRKDGRAVTVPGAAFTSVRDGQFTDQRIYVDLTPVFA